MRKRKKMSMDEILTKYWPSPSQQEVEADCEEVWTQLEAELEKHDTSLWSLYGDGWSAAPLKQIESQVLTAVSLLGDRGTLKSITQMVDKWTGREMVGHVYLTLGRFAERELITVHSGPATGGDKPFDRFEITEDGDRALRRAKIEGKQLVTARESLESECLRPPGESSLMAGRFARPLRLVERAQARQAAGPFSRLQRQSPLVICYRYRSLRADDCGNHKQRE